MKYPAFEDYVFYKGAKFQVEFYFTPKGEIPAKEYLEFAGEQIKLKLSALVKHMADTGRLFDERKFRLVDRQEKIYEFKPREQRFFNFFYEGKKIIITNAYHKKGQKVDKRELAKVVNFKMDYEFRVKGGIYYENN
jgi:hypothetical protein